MFAKPHAHGRHMVASAWKCARIVAVLIAVANLAKGVVQVICHGASSEAQDRQNGRDQNSNDVSARCASHRQTPNIIFASPNFACSNSELLTGDRHRIPVPRRLQWHLAQDLGITLLISRAVRFLTASGDSDGQRGPEPQNDAPIAGAFAEYEKARLVQGMQGRSETKARRLLRVLQLRIGAMSAASGNAE